MYETYYHFQDKPFQLSPDPSFFFSSRGHRRAMAYLVYGVHQGEGFIVITGEIGAGKTMLARALTRNMASQNLVLGQVVSTSLEADDVVRTVAAAFGLSQENSKAVLLNRIEQFLLACHRQGKRVLLLVDEVQNLPVRSLEELRMLSNFVYADKALLQRVWDRHEHFKVGYSVDDMRRLFPQVVAMRGCYWRDYADAMFERLGTISTEDLLDSVTALKQEALQDIRDELPSYYPECKGIWVLAHADAP